MFWIGVILGAVLILVGIAIGIVLVGVVDLRKSFDRNWAEQEREMQKYGVMGKKPGILAKQLQKMRPIPPRQSVRQKVEDEKVGGTD